jgi:hypothetical protein
LALRVWAAFLPAVDRFVAVVCEVVLWVAI